GLKSLECAGLAALWSAATLSLTAEYSTPNWSSYPRAQQFIAAKAENAAPSGQRSLSSCRTCCDAVWNPAGQSGVPSRASRLECHTRWGGKSMRGENEMLEETIIVDIVDELKR